MVNDGMGMETNRAEDYSRSRTCPARASSVGCPENHPTDVERHEQGENDNKVQMGEMSLSLMSWPLSHRRSDLARPSRASVGEKLLLDTIRG